MTRRIFPLASLSAFLRSWLADERGQDLVEYALLAAFLATAGMLALQAIGPAVANTYNAWIDPTAGTPSLWEPGAPGGS